MIELFRKWTKHEYSVKQRIIALGFAGILFLLILPYTLVTYSIILDHHFLLPQYRFGHLNPIIGISLIATGAWLALWSINTQFRLGMGTPLPMMPTRKLLIEGPFIYCRNPMTLGTFIGYLGIGVWLGSLSAILIVVLFTVMLILYLKLVEEKELESRFGPPYLEYKHHTPFMIPRIRKPAL